MCICTVFFNLIVTCYGITTCQIRVYNLANLVWDKSLTTNIFGKPLDEKNECVILIAINIYDMDIDNLDFKLDNLVGYTFII